MCRGKNICSELGANPENWDTFSPLRTPNWIAEQFEIFESAVNDFFTGQKEACLQKIKQIKSEEITNWFIEHGQMSGRHRKIILKNLVPPKIPKEQRDTIRSPKKIQDEVFKRDGYRCRYCGNKIISQAFLRLFIKKLNSPIFYRGETNLTKHGIIHISWPIADHVIPWNQGGLTVINNLVTACATCNYGKDGYTFEQLGIQNPFNRQPIVDKWNGLTDKLALLESM